MEHGNLRGNGNKKNKTSGVSAKAKTRGRQGTGTEQNNHSGPDSKLVIINHDKLEDKIVRRVLSTTAFISSDASGLVTVASYGIADVITLLGAEWTKFAQEYQEFRIRSFTMKFFPATTSATSTTGPYQTAILVAPWRQLRPTNANTLFQSRSKEIFSTLYEKYITLTSNNFANAKLWSTYGLTYQADRDYGLSWTTLSTFAASSRMFTVLFQLDAEFRHPQ